MEKRAFGKTGMQVSVLGFGGAEVGLTPGVTEAAVKELLNGALDAGLNVIDTAECYGTSEELIGKVLSHRRKDFYLFTKCGHHDGWHHPDWDRPERLAESLDRSLMRLKTDRVDLWQIHSCSKEVLAKGEVVEIVKKAKQSGKTRFIGYSGEHEDACYAVSLGIFDTLQTSVSIADQMGLDTVLPEAVKRGMGIIAKRPIANAAWTHQDRPYEYIAPYWDRLKDLDYDFLKDGGRAAETALRFTLAVPGVSTLIVGTQKPGRWQENARVVAKGPLSIEEFNAIRARWKAAARPEWVGQV